SRRHAILRRDAGRVHRHLTIGARERQQRRNRQANCIDPLHRVPLAGYRFGQRVWTTGPWLHAIQCLRKTAVRAARPALRDSARNPISYTEDGGAQMTKLNWISGALGLAACSALLIADGTKIVNLVEGQGAFVDASNLKPGTFRKITASDLP